VDWAVLTRWTWLALVLLQPAWHALLPPPHGAGRWALAAVATVPLLLPLRGVWSGKLRAVTWAGYLAMVYLVIGIMEAWANPPQRVAALLQVVLVILFVAGALGLSRSGKSAG
jgi:uncharacterized membrane protein